MSSHGRCPVDMDTQNAFYNGWLHGAFASNLLCFAADGCIIHYVVNAPGSWHDQKLETGHWKQAMFGARNADDCRVEKL